MSENWQDRVRAERIEIGERLIKLSAFMSAGPAFFGLDLHTQGLMREQRAAMQDYVDILDKRIARF